MKIKSSGRFSITKGTSEKKQTKQKKNITPKTKAAEERRFFQASSRRATGEDERDEALTPYERWERFMDVVAFPENHIPELPEMHPETKESLQIVLNEMNPFTWSKTNTTQTKQKAQKKEKNNNKKWSKK